MALSGGEREHVALLRRRAHAAGGLAQAVADAASPLAMSKSLQVAVQSFGVVAQALRVLAATTEAVELDEGQVCTAGWLAGWAGGLGGLAAKMEGGTRPGRCAHPTPCCPQIQELARRRTDVAAPDPDTPRLLPSVHRAWAPLLGALQVRHPGGTPPACTLPLPPEDLCALAPLACMRCCLPSPPLRPLLPQDWRVSVVEAALQFLADCACLAGSFLRKRLAQEAAPALQRLLADGPTHRNLLAPGARCCRAAVQQGQRSRARGRAEPALLCCTEAGTS